MNKQDVLNTVTAHLRQQKGRSFNVAGGGLGGGSCMYFGPEGTRCAVGCLLPETMRSKATGESWNSYGVSFLNEDIRALLGIDPLGGDIEFLHALQRAHDPKENWTDDSFNALGEAALRNVASNYGLKVAS